MKHYLKALVILIFYVIFTRLEFLAMVFYPSTFVALTLVTLVASISGVAFLYFFDHEKLFKFARVIKEKKKKTEQKLLAKFLKFGAFGAVVIIGFLAGPLFCALTAHLLLPTYKHKHLLVLAVSASSAFIAISFARGALHLAFKLL